MNRHLDVLALLYVVWGALFLLAGLIGLALTVGAAALAFRAGGDVGVELAGGLPPAASGVAAGGPGGRGVVWHARSGAPAVGNGPGPLRAMGSPARRGPVTLPVGRGIV